MWLGKLIRLAYPIRDRIISAAISFHLKRDYVGPIIKGLAQLSHQHGTPSR